MSVIHPDDPLDLLHPTSLANLDVLLVEDDDVDAMVAQRFMSMLPGRRNRPLRRAVTLEGAIEQIREREPAAILADLTLPDSDGLWTVEKLIESARTRP